MSLSTVFFPTMAMFMSIGRRRKIQVLVLLIKRKYFSAPTPSNGRIAGAALPLFHGDCAHTVALVYLDDLIGTSHAA